MAEESYVYIPHEYGGGFCWNSKLSRERQKEIAAWIKTLNNHERAMLHDIIQDSRDDIAHQMQSEYDEYGG